MFHMTAVPHRLTMPNVPIMRPQTPIIQSDSEVPMPYKLDDYPILDMPQVRHVVLSNPEILQALKIAFTEDTQKRLDTLESLRQHPEAAQQSIKKLLHALKGEARSIAAVRLGELAHRLEQEAEANNLNAVFSHLTLLHEEFNNWQALMETVDWTRVLQSPQAPQH